MSFLDLDEWLFDLNRLAEVVYSPVVDAKVYPDHVDLVLVEGAVCNEEHLHMAQRLRQCSRTVVSFGDCAVTGNVTAMRNPLGKADCVLRRAYLETAQTRAQIPREPGLLPALLDRVLPLHDVIKVDHYLPGCPPPAERVRALLEPALTQQQVQLHGPHIRFG
jgi:NAD-reducing hydrogenase small subunit